MPEPLITLAIIALVVVAIWAVVIAGSYLISRRNGHDWN